MHHKTQGIVLNTTKYNDKFSIAHILTRDFGRVAYLVPRAQGKRPKMGSALFAPLSVLQLEVEHQPLREIQRLKEAKRQLLLYDCTTNPTKVSLLFFLSEFLAKVLRETDNNEVLFDYLKNALEVLEASSNGLANFHLTFILGLSRFLGIYPNLNGYTRGCCFDMLNGKFYRGIPAHNYCLNARESAYLNELSRISFSNMHLFKLSRGDRNLIIERLLTYYRLHLYNFADIKSLDILKELS